jgi:hypothetical protein
MSCPFYGKHAVADDRFPLIDSGGNQCALILDSFAPCVMEVSLAREPDAAKCGLLRVAAVARVNVAADPKRDWILFRDLEGDQDAS